MKCSTEDLRDIRGFNFFVENCNKDYLSQKFNLFRKHADENNKTYIVRIAESNYFRFEVLLIPKGPTLLSLSTARGTNNITLRSLSSIEELTKLTYCAYNNPDVKKLFDQFLTASTRESEIVDLLERRDEVEVNNECQEVKLVKLELPMETQGKWVSSEILTINKLSLKALTSGQTRFVSISTERPQNSIKFTNFERIKSLFCFVAMVNEKMNKCDGLKEVVTALLESNPKTRRKRSKNE
ncbi:hypothetical protein [Sulfolobus acidocaldarius]|uniref:Conserved protein n=2 Tax=Sulfolobus acidocaldarius TaxID=2285 RepID=Q4JCP4_SULAC|nr:hypothetical protein [Sulfolobus acidocaldarius]AAY79435.1 conserved protein [Sulfolobus acidocaldarius DSM 639]ALU29579.1 hypothetical protein ATY89_06220 [Sulfolobus acidocaldarius]ALU32310.1 hypothetical protein ATZ20_09245 [Sulfolobus acidocaldarius]